MHIGEKQFKSEMLSQKKLSDLYEDKLQQGEERIQDLQNLVTDLEGKIETFAQERIQLLDENKENLKSLQQQVLGKDAEIQKLKVELENVNQNFPQSVAGVVSQNGVSFHLLKISLVY
jgi:DNA repair exonuclease SbcCD ATPase subunit